MAHRTEEVSRKFAFRNPADAADAMYENVVRGRGGETKRTSAGSDDVRCGEGNCLFYGVEAKTYDIVPGKVAGSYFRDPVSFPSIPLHVPLSLSLPSCSYTSPFVFRERHKFPPEKYDAMTRELSFAYFFSPYRRPFSRSQARKPYHREWDCNYVASIERRRLIIVILTKESKDGTRKKKGGFGAIVM